MSTPPSVNNEIRGPGRQGTPPTPLAEKLAHRIRRDGPMSFCAFMERALYEPGDGYYARAHTPWSDGADFVTAPQVDAAFGAAVARLAAECDAALDEPSSFDLVEFGGGDGTLLRDACDAIERASPRLYERLRVCSVERGSASREQQQRRLEAHAPRVRWASSADDLGADTLQGLVVSNELLDAFPVHRVMERSGRLRELYVDIGDDGFVEREGPPSTPELGDYLRDNGVVLGDGQIAEICLGVRPWIEQVSRSLQRGFVLTVDYGAESSSLYSDARPRGSLVCQYRYQLTDSPFVRVGQQDITAHVDFGNLRRCASKVGLEEVGNASLAVFLVGFGAGEDMGPAIDGEKVDARSVRKQLGLRHLLFTEIGAAHRAVLQRKNVRPVAFGVSRLG